MPEKDSVKDSVQKLTEEDWKKVPKRGLGVGGSLTGMEPISSEEGTKQRISLRGLGWRGRIPFLRRTKGS